MLLSQDDIYLFYRSPLIVQVYLPQEQNQISHGFILSKFPENNVNIYLYITEMGIALQ